MSDTYNPNGIVRCKHLNEFARQLRIKLDGGTDPKTARPVSDVRIAGVDATLEGGIYKGTVTPSSFTGTPRSISINFDSTSITTNTLAAVGAFEAPAIYSANNSRLSMRYKSFLLYVSTSATPVVGDVIKLTLVLAEDDTYAELRVPYEITIVADE